MQLGQLLEPSAALPDGSADLEIDGLTADSREVRPGYLFAALPGTETDGAKFLPQAVEKGAAAVLLPAGSAARSGLQVPVIEDPNPRRRLALMAARFYPAQPEVAVAVTGTNGKTSVVSFVRQIWQGLGASAASLGTLGIEGGAGGVKLIHTTPDPVTLHRALSDLVGEGVTHLALEASSHGLQQYRLDGVRLRAAAFTNISRDHLDYHDTFEDYLAQKLRLFRELLPADGIVVVDPDAPGGDAVCNAAETRGLTLFRIGPNGSDLKLASVAQDGFKQRLSLEAGGQAHDIVLPLVGGFQVANALVAAGLCIAAGAAAAEVLPLLAHLKGAKGRLEHAGTAATGAPIFIDYAHTPDALENALRALRPYTAGRLAVVFGCGGDRDRGKRPEMGAVAEAHADRVYVTDDNPRGEDPAAIRAGILAAAPEATEIGGRQEAIAASIAALKAGDMLLIAGKGHETGQIVGDDVIPFSDHDAVQAALGAEAAHG